MIMIIELCGLPGCGKSTLFKELKKKWKEEGEKEPIYGREEVLKRNLAIRALDRVLFDKYSVGERKELIRIINDNARHDSDWERRYIHRLLELTEGIRRMEGKNLILDEGLIQYITSLAYGSHLVAGEGLDNLIKKVFPKNVEYYIINCNIPVETSIERVRERNRKNDRYDVGNEETRKKLMSVKKENIDILLNSKVLKNKNILNLNMTDASDKNAETVWEFVNSGRPAVK